MFIDFNNKRKIANLEDRIITLENQIKKLRLESETYKRCFEVFTFPGHTETKRLTIKSELASMNYLINKGL